MEALIAPWRSVGIDKVAGIEARVSFWVEPWRTASRQVCPDPQAGKLPHETVRVAYCSNTVSTKWKCTRTQSAGAR